jgi:WD40-like Beta Propeller Repeat
MMPVDRFERQLQGLLTELADPRMPDYLDDVLRQTASTSQRPAWSFLERWLPMVDIARQLVLAPPMPWRVAGLGLVLLALLLGMLAAIAVGTHPTPPAPFGPARNGLVIYARDGDIFSVDADTGASTPLVTGPDTDLNPRWSLDGTKFAFERRDGDGGHGRLYVAGADGLDRIRVTPEVLPGFTSYVFSPDGKELLIGASPATLGPEVVPRILIAAVDGSQIRQLKLPGPATNARWRPPDGSQILFMDRGDNTNGFGGLYTLDLRSGEIRTILQSVGSRHRAHALWSPDGSRIAYVEWTDSSELTAQTHVIAADGTGDRVLPAPPGVLWQTGLAWSNDGTRLLAIRGRTGGYEDSVAVALPIDGGGFGVEIDGPGFVNPACCTTWEWAPDDSSILGTLADSRGLPLDQVLLDPLRGTAKAVPWTTSSSPSWQRR